MALIHSLKEHFGKSKLLLVTVIFCLPADLSAQKKVLPVWPLPKGLIRIIIDTDAANEVDDQWAIALALGYPERLKIEGFVAANYGIRGGAKGIDKSYNSILEVLETAGMKDKFTVKKGSDPIVYLDRPPESEGVDFIISTAKTASPEHPLYIVSIGAATNVAAAILKDSTIQKNIVVLWHGRTVWPERCWNFNAINDLKAVQVLFGSSVPFILFDTGTFLTMPMEESEKRISCKGAFGSYLHNIRKMSTYAQLPQKGFFDVGDIAALINEHVIDWEITDVPEVADDYKYNFSKDKGKFVRIYAIQREPTFRLLDKALNQIELRRKE